ncbi:hypothetical protein WAI453_005405 [Rhynchosporium graminicola]|uniref:Aminoglycoside phosphotransferase domain-containing protein n=1 Tax=Rhynchosporium graminicola TaxID=2792576 RepID=A0A1E1LRZ0_9HELO|nr:uncharacterized protein RCO7_05297 [Rhynchosporium commune]
MSTSGDGSIENPPQSDTTNITTTIRQMNGPPLTCSQALNTDFNFILEAGYVPETEAFYNKLWAERDVMRVVVKHHLGLSDKSICTIADQHDWMRGFFNVCIPVEVQSPDSFHKQKLILRCAMPHKLAEAYNPGSVDEKMGCEVGAYAWIQERCPEIRIPHLYGFAFSNQRHFTHEAHLPLHTRAASYLRRKLHKLLKHPLLLSRYTKNPSGHRLSSAYMLLENVRTEDSHTLASNWERHQEDPIRRYNLSRSIARIMLSLARFPQSKIGSFQFHPNGTVTLTNRPLICTAMIHENEGAPMSMQRETTYTSTEPFVADMFHFHDKRFSGHPNVIDDAEDCREEMAIRLLNRMVAHHYIRQDHRNGPYFLQLNDFHASNVFVDSDWNITSLIDLEWICALPVELLEVPYWLSGCEIDEPRKERWEDFNVVRKEFLKIFEAEACVVRAEHGISLAKIMRESWESGGVWFWHGITSQNAMTLLFKQHIQPRFLGKSLAGSEEEMLSSFWSEDSGKVVQRKVEELEKYKGEVESLFSNGVKGGSDGVNGSKGLE